MSVDYITLRELGQIGIGVVKQHFSVGEMSH
jgi:hypothetical protein